MATDREATDDRRRRLEQVRAEIEREVAAGKALDAAEWGERHPDLRPEIATILTELRGVPLGPETISSGSVAANPAGQGPAIPTTVAFTREMTGGVLETQGVPPADPPRSPSSGSGLGADGPTEPGPDARGTMPTAPFGERRSNGPLAPGSRVRYLGDYELLKVLGQGGMGVVYEARQISLNRSVALKLIRNADFASADQLRRFQNEAEAVALLDHPGIVPIYEVGHHEDQRYFSMKLIEGDGLDKRLERLSQDPWAAAKLVTEVAGAVHHAHQRGLLHRDLKPANILVDRQGHPHVTDFGLAKRIEGESGLTVSGAIMGTPAYMAPEQASGRNSQVTTSSDVYGLGAILYAVLTGRAPFSGDSVLETLERVRHSQPLTPSRINAKLPLDLEVICLKCLEKDPRRRYASAQALADDLNRWIDGEPIAARPVGRAVRAWMWARRRPALAGLSAALAAALVVGVVGIAWQWREAVFQRNAAEAARDKAVREEAAARKAEGEAKAARDAAQAARTLAEQNAQLAGMQATLALSTVQDMVSQVQTKIQAPGLYELKTGLLDTALKRVDGVASVYDKSTSKEATTLAALVELARIYRELGQSAKAFGIYERCLAIAKERVKIKQGSDPSRQNLANVYRDLALSVEEMGRDMKASQRYNEESLRIWEDVFKNPKADGFALDKKVVRSFLAEAYMRVGIGLYRLGDLTAALDNFRKAHNLRRELVDAVPDNPAFKQDLSYSTMALAETSYRLGDRATAEDLYRQVLEQRQKMADANPNAPKILEELAAVNYMIGEFKMRIGDHAAARKHLGISRDLRTSLVDADPKNTVRRRDLGVSLYHLGNLADRENDPKAAREAFEAAYKIQQALVDLDAKNDKRLYELAPTLAHVGQVDKAAEVADRLGAGPNVDNELRVSLARCYAQCARATPPERPERARAFLTKAMEILRSAVKEGYRDRVTLEVEPDLDPLRGLDEFRTLVSDVKVAP